MCLIAIQKLSYTVIGILDPLFGNPAYPYPFPRKAGAFDAFKATQRLIDDAEAAESEGFEFSEVMSGYIHIGNDIDDFECARRAARGACEAARFFLSMHTWDIETSRPSQNQERISEANPRSGKPK